MPERARLDHGLLVEFIEHRWIEPSQGAGGSLDDEDLARARLIMELRRDFGVNDEAIPIILHLVDELHALRRWARRRALDLEDHWH